MEVGIFHSTEIERHGRQWDMRCAYMSKNEEASSELDLQVVYDTKYLNVDFNARVLTALWGVTEVSKRVKLAERSSGLQCSTSFFMITVIVRIIRN